MTDHAPLTASQRELCAKLAQAPIRLTSGEMVSSAGFGLDANFLSNAGYANAEVVFVAQESKDSIIQLTRSAKPLPPA